MELNTLSILVVGLARTGIACARFLAKEGARVTVTDMKTAEQVAGPRGELRILSSSVEFGPGRDRGGEIRK